VWINPTQYFDNVPPEVWSYHSRCSNKLTATTLAIVQSEGQGDKGGVREQLREISALLLDQRDMFKEIE
jgi:hypothetical protein